MLFWLEDWCVRRYITYTVCRCWFSTSGTGVLNERVGEKFGGGEDEGRGERGDIGGGGGEKESSMGGRGERRNRKEKVFRGGERRGKRSDGSGVWWYWMGKTCGWRKEIRRLCMMGKSIGVERTKERGGVLLLICWLVMTLCWKNKIKNSNFNFSKRTNQ